MQHPSTTVQTVKAAAAISRQGGRWTLHRAGIVNVYQYENEVLHFSGGRLLLRGVNGSGKSTAMNMLLPFLLTARLGRIDAAGEQTGVLKSWMLTGRDDAQPVGYLWVEFECYGEYFVCGCGIKANRQSDVVTTWWFITSKRPGFDLTLVERGVPLSADALRSALDGDEVFGHDRRRDYRLAIERRLFGGVSLDQHVGLLNIVRNPRVGDRIDIDLPAHLIDALPRLSEQALAEAAQPLDDLEEHRRNVVELARTVDALDGLLDVYRPYCVAEMRRHIADGGERVATAGGRAREETRLQHVAKQAEDLVHELGESADSLDRDTTRLRREIQALEESQAYRDGQQLEALRDFVAELDSRRCQFELRVAELIRRAEVDGGIVGQAEARTDLDLSELAERLVDLSRLTQRCGLAQRPPSPPGMTRTALAGLGCSMPNDEFDGDGFRRALDRVAVAGRSRRADIDDVLAHRTALDGAETRQQHTESDLERASITLQQASSHRDEQRRQLIDLAREWRDEIHRWALDAHVLFDRAGVDGPAVSAAASGAESDGDHARLRAGLLDEVDRLVGHWQRVVANLCSRLEAEQNSVAIARTLVEQLEAQSEPAPPRLTWQAKSADCLADLVDFVGDVSATEQAGIEAALEASGLLSARLDDGGTLQLANGDLVVIAAGGVTLPLSEWLTVTVPDHLVGTVDSGLVVKLLDSISTDVSSDATTVVARDGSFRVGALHGRHHKERAEHIGVTARRATLERHRAGAATALAEAEAVVAYTEAELNETRDALEAVDHNRRVIPSTDHIERALLRVGEAERAQSVAEHAITNAAKEVAEADRARVVISDELHRVATTLQLPTDRRGLDGVGDELRDAAFDIRNATQLARNLDRSIGAWRDAVERWRTTVADTDAERVALGRVAADYDEQRTRLATLEDSIGIEYHEVVAARDHSREELGDVERRVPVVRDARDEAVRQHAEAAAALRLAGERKAAAEHDGSRYLEVVQATLAVPGLLDAVTGEPSTVIDVPKGGVAGLAKVLDMVAALVSDQPIGAVTADGVRRSLLARRDALGAGWDADTTQPDPTGALSIEVVGPTGRAALPASVRRARDQYNQLSALLNRKQDDALRELLQGLIAREVAEKLNGASHLVALMNTRLETVTTAHGVGVRLRWRRSPELDVTMARTVELLSKRPDLRTDDEERELRQSLSDRLDDARRMHPDLPYRQLIADTLDYRQWHEMAIMLRRANTPEVKLGRLTPLSEGEKKLVSYLPLFAAVAASCDALAEDQASVPRFILLDDAFAKVSEDNHAALFGLLVELDLDVIATSERLWGTHDTVPQLAITEVIRDVALGAILLEHYRWDGANLERVNQSYGRGTS